MARLPVTDLNSLAELVEDMILQLSYPGFDARSLKLGLPEDANRAPAKIFANALQHESVYLRLVGLRWFQDRAGVARAHNKAIYKCLSDGDPWVRREALLCVERLEGVDESVYPSIIACLCDADAEVRKGAAKALGKLGNKSESIIEALKQAAEDKDVEVRFKVQKALRKLGGYVA